MPSLKRCAVVLVAAMSLLVAVPTASGAYAGWQASAGAQVVEVATPTFGAGTFVVSAGTVVVTLGLLGVGVGVGLLSISLTDRRYRISSRTRSRSLGITNSVTWMSNTVATRRAGDDARRPTERKNSCTRPILRHPYDHVHLRGHGAIAHLSPLLATRRSLARAA
jgi:hypothetical protein